jgi:hypothetical protein
MLNLRDPRQAASRYRSRVRETGGLPELFRFRFYFIEILLSDHLDRVRVQQSARGPGGTSKECFGAKSQPSATLAFSEFRRLDPATLRSQSSKGEPALGFQASRVLL